MWLIAVLLFGKIALSVNLYMGEVASRGGDSHFQKCCDITLVKAKQRIAITCVRNSQQEVLESFLSSVAAAVSKVCQYAHGLSSLLKPFPCSKCLKLVIPYHHAKHLRHMI